MSLLTSILFLFIGAFLLTLGSNYFVDGASRVAKRLGVSQLVIGTTMVALGTSLPEFSVSFISALKDMPSLSIGNIVGSNICNICLILGFSSIIRPVKTLRYVLKFEYPVLFLSSLLLFLFSINGIIGRIEALSYIILLLYFLRFYYKKLPKEDFEKDKNVSAKHAFIITIFGLLALLMGSELFIKSAVFIARILGVSELVIGLSLVALGTSLPELASTTAAVLKQKDEIALGNVIGSNILNILFIVGSVSFIKPIKTEVQLTELDIPYMIFVTILLFIILRFKERIDRKAGALFVVLYLLYIGIILKTGRIAK